MRYFIFVLILFVQSFISSAQIDSIALYYADYIDSDQLRYRIDVLANDSLLGRETAKIGQQKAEKFIISEFEKDDLAPGNKDSYLQYFNVYQLNFNDVKFTFNENIIESQKQIININIDENCELNGSDIIFCSYGISAEGYDNYNGLDVQDKLVFVIDGTPKEDNGKAVLSKEVDFLWSWKRELKEELALKNGAKGIVFIKDDFHSYSKEVKYYIESGRTKLFNDLEREINFPSIAMDQQTAFNLLQVEDKDIRRYINKENKSRGKKVIEQKGIFSFEFKVDLLLQRTSNVMAKIESEDPSAPWIILSAHYDHIGYDTEGVYNGADDNGSGTASIIELARVFKKAYNDGVKPKRNILFILVSGEEKGLLGSKFYTQNPIYSISNTMVNLNVDMIGRVDKKHKGNSNYVYVIGADRISQKLHDINEEMNASYTHLELDYTYNQLSDQNRYYERSDHYNFAKEGVPVIFYFNGTHEDYHRKGDTADKIDYQALLSRTKLIFHTAWELSQMEGVLLD